MPMLEMIRTRRSAIAIALCAVALVLVALSVTGCVAVKPWERERLSHPGMLLEPQLGDSYRPHVLSIREGSVGAGGARGGGCGCN